MLGRKKAEDICKDVLSRAGKDPAEVLLFFEDQSLTRFANNYIHQNVAERNATLIVRLLRGKRMGLATTNRLDRDGLDKLVERARANGNVSPEDPDYPGLPEPASYAAVDGFDQFTAEYSPEARARAVGEICRLTAEKGLNGSGVFSTGTNEVVVANSQNVFAYHCGTNADFQTVVISEDSSGRGQGSEWRVDNIPVESLGLEAIKKAEDGRNPRRVDPGEYTVVLTPYATEDILNMLNYYGMGAQPLLEGRSWMNDRLGEKVMSQLVDIWDDGVDSAGVPMPFDFEGVPKRRVNIVEEGVVKSPVFDRITAKKMGEETTGHALPPTMRSFGPLATNLFMAPGRSSTEEMIKSTGRGLYVSRFWYTRLVHPRDCVITGMTRDGVFFIENGELAYPVKDLRFTQSYVEALARAEIVGRETRLLVSEFGGQATRVPALKINQFNFTGSTV
ncbi:MAG: TldD/PmbA family protein [Syntrophobacterales bacterium]|jgi:predicted Zn-dependent protease